MKKLMVMSFASLILLMSGCVSTYDSGITHVVTPRPTYGPQAPSRPIYTSHSQTQPNRPYVTGCSCYGSRNCTCTSTVTTQSPCQGSHCSTNKVNTSVVTYPVTVTGYACRYNSDCRYGEKCVRQRGQNEGQCRKP